MDSKQAEQWQQKAQGIACGNTWGKLEGRGEVARHCGECGQHVHNLQAVSEKELQSLIRRHPEGVCVVNETPRGFSLKKVFASVLSLLCIGIPTATAGDKKSSPNPMPPGWEEHWQVPEEKPRECQSLLYTPMMLPPTMQCINEKGKRVDFRKWSELFHKKHRHDDPLP